jgi:hypothetical protein
MDKHDLKKLNDVMSSNSLVTPDASVEFRKNNSTKITFLVENDISFKIVSLTFPEESSNVELLCLLYELGIWCETDEDNRVPIGQVIIQYNGHLPTFRLSIQTQYK